MLYMMKCSLNPLGSADRSETGGLMSALRVLTVEQSNVCHRIPLHYYSSASLVRDYNHSYYVPRNLLLVIAGKFIGRTMSLSSDIQEKVELDLIAHGQNTGHRLPGFETVSRQKAACKDDSRNRRIISPPTPPRQLQLWPFMLPVLDICMHLHLFITYNTQLSHQSSQYVVSFTITSKFTLTFYYT
jgi:hypothetical protein